MLQHCGTCHFKTHLYYENSSSFKPSLHLSISFLGEIFPQKKVIQKSYLQLVWKKTGEVNLISKKGREEIQIS